MSSHISLLAGNQNTFMMNEKCNGCRRNVRLPAIEIYESFLGNKFLLMLLGSDDMSEPMRNLTKFTQALRYYLATLKEKKKFGASYKRFLQTEFNFLVLLRKLYDTVTRTTNSRNTV